MPSGSKKRKAAKKKKENQSNNNNNPSSSADNNQTHGEGDDVKQQDDKDSDVGEVSSPASQDHNSQHNVLSEEEEEEIEEKGVNEPPNVAAEANFVPVEREFKIDDELNKTDGKFEHDEIATKSYDGGSSRSYSSDSSSDDESNEIKNEINDSKGKDSTDPSVVEYEFTDNGDKKTNSVENKVGISEEEIIIPSVVNVAPISDTTECAVQETDDRLSVSYNEPIASADNQPKHENESGVSEPLLAPASHPVQTTSWKSCCGLFELFTGSGR